MKEKKKYNTKPTIRQLKAIKILVEKGGSVGSAMRSAGFSDKTAHNPSKLTKSINYIKHLERAGVTDSFLAEKQHVLSSSARIEARTFDSFAETKTISVGENGRKLRKPIK